MSTTKPAPKHIGRVGGGCGALDAVDCSTLFPVLDASGTGMLAHPEKSVFQGQNKMLAVTTNATSQKLLEILENLNATSNSDAKRKKPYPELCDLEHQKSARPFPRNHRPASSSTTARCVS